MKIVQKANKQLRVPDERLQDMLNRGYVEVDEKTGKPVAKEPVDEVAILKKENAALKKTNKELVEKVEALTKQLQEQAAANEK